LDLEIFRTFLTSQIRHCDVYWDLRQISTGLRQPDPGRKCDFSRWSTTFKVNMVATCKWCRRICKNHRTLSLYL